MAYEPPYDGWAWSYSWNRSDEPDDPSISHVVDPNTGQLGSSIRWRLDGADNDDEGTATYYTGLRQWHRTGDRTGRLEVDIGLRPSTARYWGRNKDEWGISHVVVHSFARVVLNVLGPDGNWDRQDDAALYMFFSTRSGFSWSEAIVPSGARITYNVWTDTFYDPGTWVLVEVGLRNVSWFTADDVNIRHNNLLDFDLERMRMRSRAVREYNAPDG